MGFPIGYSDLLLPKLFLNLLFLLSLLRRLVSSAFHAFGLDLELDHQEHHHLHRKAATSRLKEETLPSSLLYEDLDLVGSAQLTCAVCLHEFEGREEVRRLSRCRHVFHRRCLDPWVELDQWTCPLCRAPIADVARHYHPHLPDEVW